MLNKISVCIILSVFCSCIAGVEIDCKKPPQLVDPALCCRDGGRDEVTESCAKRLGITGAPNEPPPTMEVATCLAECVLTESRYMTQPETLSIENIRSNLQAKFNNDTAYVKAMHEAYEKCQTHAQKRMQTFRKATATNALPIRGCSPFASMVLGCTYMEYFKNCPANRWTENNDCALAKQFVQQCGLGAA